MKNLYRILFLFIPINFLISCYSNNEKDIIIEVSQNEKKKVLLIGTFHYNNPGTDVAKTKAFNVLDKESQNQLEQIAEKISEFNPNKVFVEWPFEEQKKLDSLYKLYSEDTYFKGSLSDFYRKSEIFQLAFRFSKKNKLESLNAVDYRETSFPFDSLVNVISVNKQSALKAEIDNGIKAFTTEFDRKIENGSSLLDLTYFLNSDDMRKKSNRFHTELPLLAGGKENFIGPYLVSEWHRRNLTIWSLIQKSLETDDRRIVLLLGASHIAMIKDYIDRNDDFEVVELKMIMEN